MTLRGNLNAPPARTQSSAPTSSTVSSPTIAPVASLTSSNRCAPSSTPGITSYPSPSATCSATLASVAGSTTHSPLTDLGRDYFRAWLRLNGIDSDTGRMTVDGLAFFQDLTQPDHDRPAA